MALSQMELDPARVVIVSGIGCSGRFPGFVKCYGFHTVHGRALPVALGVKVANPELTVIVVGGDGDGLGIGGGHIPHIARRNPDITYLILDNSLYGQTKGQTSPTTPKGAETSTSPYGNLELPLNPVLMALSYGASFVARGYAGPQTREQLTQITIRAIQHKGFSFVHVLSPCPTFNERETFKYYNSKVAEIVSDHDTSDRIAAIALALGNGNVPIGVFYEETRPLFEEGLAEVRERAQTLGAPSLEPLLNRFLA